MNVKKNLTTKETFTLALQHQKKNNFKIAEKLYEEILKIDSKYAGAHNNLGVIYRALGKLQKAISCYEKVIKIHPNHAGAHYNLGMVFNELGKPK